jgi:beta-lactamase class A
MASLPRRHFLFAGGSCVLAAACSPSKPMTAATTPKLDVATLNGGLGEIAARLAPGRLGVGLLNFDSGEVFTVEGDRLFPLQGFVSTPLAAATLEEVSAGRLSLQDRVRLKAMDLSPPPSAVAAAWPGRADYTVGELLAAAASGGDTMAADVLMARIGGPGAVTAWLDSKRIDEIRIDRYARELLTDEAGLQPFRPAWTGEAAFQAAIAATPPDRQRRALAAYLADPRDTATPRAALRFLHMLESGELLPSAARARLLTLLAARRNPGAGVLAGLPNRSRFVHAAAGSRPVLGVLPAVNDVGVATLPDGRRYAVAVFLAGSGLSPAAADAVLGQVARVLVRGLG